MNFRVKRFAASAPKFLREMAQAGQAHFSLVRFAQALFGPCADQRNNFGVLDETAPKPSINLNYLCIRA